MHDHYDYNRLLNEYLRGIPVIINIFAENLKRHYGHDNVDEEKLSIFMDTLYKFIRDLYHSGRKHSRAVQAYYIFPELDNEIRMLLTAVDLYIAMLDEIYDEKLTRPQKLKILGTITAIQPYIYECTKKPDIADILGRYISMPVHIVLTQRKRHLSLTHWYYWRGSAMDFFMETPARLKRYDNNTVKTFIEAGRWLRAIILVWKDLRDVEHDREQGTENPFINQDINSIVLVRELYDKLNNTIKNLDEEYGERINEIAEYYIERL